MTIVAGQTARAADVANGANMPPGFVGVWTGTIANIPPGWVICDGNNGTPNLLGRFIEGVATAATNPGTTGGSTAKTTITPSHTLTITEMPAHTHAIQTYYSGYTDGVAAGLNSPAGATQTQSAGGGGGHVHPDSSIADIRPLFFDVAFIMKT